MEEGEALEKRDNQHGDQKFNRIFLKCRLGDIERNPRKAR